VKGRTPSSLLFNHASTTLTGSVWGVDYSGI